MNNLNKYQKIIYIILTIIAIGIVAYYVYGKNINNEEITNDEEILIKTEEKAENKAEKIVVHITGAVKKEGIVILDENSRVTDAVDAAGGLTEDADISKVNLAYILEDGVKIKIPSVNEEELEENTEGAELVENISDYNIKSEKASSGLVNINKATQTELETLPGIGPSTALKIINYREENGKFTSIEDLKNISGIGESKIENIRNLICVK